VEQFFNATLGPAVYKPVVAEYCKKLRSSTQAHGLETHVARRTPRFLRIICTPDDQQQARLSRGEKDVILMKWAAAQEYGGSMIDALTLPIVSVYP